MHLLGLPVAARLQRHEIVLRFLLSLGLHPETAERDAEGIEHHVSERTLELLAAFVARNRSRPGQAPSTASRMSSKNFSAETISSFLP